MTDQKQLSTREQLRAIRSVAAISFQSAPGAVAFKLLGSVVDAILPIATTYFAAKTTTALAAAYNGISTAKHQAIIYVLLTALLGLTMTVWSSLDGYVQSKMRYVVETRVSDRMFRHFLSLDFWRYDDKGTADLYDRAQKFSQFFAFVFDRIATIISQIISVIVSIAALVTVSWAIALFILIAVIPGVIIQFRLSRAQTKHWNQNVEVRRSLGLIEWNLLQPKYISELRLYGVVNYLLHFRARLRDKDERARIELERRTVPLSLAANALEAIAEVTVLIWITLQVIARKQPIGQFLFVQQLVSRAMSSSSSLLSTISSIDEDVANLFDYQKFMQLPIRPIGGRKLDSAPTVIIFDDVSFHYPNIDRDVLRHVSFKIEKNQHVAIVGENGAGKSTLIKLLTGLYFATDGRVLIGNDDMTELDISTWHRQLGVLQQDFISYGFATAKDNVRFGDIEATYSEERMAQSLKEAEAFDFINKLPNGLESYVNPWMEDDEGRGTELSGGQWQRLALARNFYRSAPVIILDEPTSAIDAMAEARIFKRLFSVRDKTVITISHRLSTVKKADVIFMLKDGKIAERGTYSELIEKRAEFYHMFESQIED